MNQGWMENARSIAYIIMRGPTVVLVQQGQRMHVTVSTVNGDYVSMMVVDPLDARLAPRYVEAGEMLVFCLDQFYSITVNRDGMWEFCVRTEKGEG